MALSWHPLLLVCGMFFDLFFVILCCVGYILTTPQTCPVPCTLCLYLYPGPCRARKGPSNYATYFDDDEEAEFDEDEESDFE